MPTRTLRNVAAICLSALLALTSASVLAEDAKPLSFDDIRELRRQRTPHEKIVEIAGERGLAFEVDRLTEGKLRNMGFKPEQIEELKNPGAKAAAAKAAAAAAAAAKAAAAEPDPLAMKAKEEAKIGPRMPAFHHIGVDELIRRINKDSNVIVTTVTSDHITLSAPHALANKFLADIQKVETLIKAKFPSPLKEGLDKRSAHIVLLQTRYEYQNWVRTMFAVYKERGVMFGDGEDPMGRLLRSTGFLTPNYCVLCLEAAPQEEDQRHRVGYYVGYMWMAQITEGRAPDAVVTGFGNYTETLLMGDPRVMVYSYEERNIAGKPVPWANIIADRVRTGDIATIPQVFKHSTVDMKQEQYAEGWSLVTLLAEAPEMFAKVVEAIRDMKRPMDAIEKAFGRTQEQMTEAWYKFAGGRK